MLYNSNPNGRIEYLNNYQIVNESPDDQTYEQLQYLNKNLIKERDELLNKNKMYNFIEIMFKCTLAISLIFIILVVSIGLIYRPHLILNFTGLYLQYFLTMIANVCKIISEIMATKIFWFVMMFLLYGYVMGRTEIFVRIGRNKTISILPYRTSSILRIKKMIEAQEKIKQENQILKLANGTELLDNHTVEHYKILKEQMIYLTLIEE